MQNNSKQKILHIITIGVYNIQIQPLCRRKVKTPICPRKNLILLFNSSYIGSGGGRHSSWLISYIKSSQHQNELL